MCDNVPNREALINAGPPAVSSYPTAGCAHIPSCTCIPAGRTGQLQHGYHIVKATLTYPSPEIDDKHTVYLRSQDST